MTENGRTQNLFSVLRLLSSDPRHGKAPHLGRPGSDSRRDGLIERRNASPPLPSETLVAPVGITVQCAGARRRGIFFDLI